MFDDHHITTQQSTVAFIHGQTFLKRRFTAESSDIGNTQVTYYRYFTRLEKHQLRGAPAESILLRSVVQCLLSPLCSLKARRTQYRTLHHYTASTHCAPPEHVFCVRVGVCFTNTLRRRGHVKAVNLSHELHYRIPRLLLAIKVDLSPSPRPSVSLTTEQNMIVLEGICQRVVQYPNQAALVEAEAGLVWAFHTHDYT